MAALRAVCYINQFYAGIGGEEMAHVGLNVYSEKKGPAMGMEGMWKADPTERNASNVYIAHTSACPK